MNDVAVVPADSTGISTAITDIILPANVRCGIDASSKKRALETVSELVAGAEPEVGAQSVFDCLCARERLGSTGLGHGVAIPHARVPGVARAVGVFLKLNQGIDFDAPDGEPVDLVFGLLVPEESTEAHLQILARLAEVFSDESVRVALRAGSSPEDAYAALTGAAG